MRKHITRISSSTRLRTTDDTQDEYDIANGLGSRRLVKYLAATGEISWEIDGVEIRKRKVGNRSGIPKSASTWIYELTGEGYRVEVRAVWHEGTLLAPIRTHTRVIMMTPDTADARRLYNAWLCGLSLL